MQTHQITFCAIVLLAAQALASAQKTEIRVERGKIVAETANASVAVEAGRKVVLTPDAGPAISVDNPLVRDVMKLNRLVEAEKQRSDLKIDSAFILVGSGDKDNILGAMYFEFPNWRPEPTDVFTLPSASIIPDLQVYDSAGNLLQVDRTIRDETTASYTIHTKEPVPAGGHFRLIGVANLQDMPLIPGGAPAYFKEGPVWYFRTINQMPNCLNYFRLILPPSAILLDTNRPVISTDNVDGRLAVTMRNYTGPYSDGTCIIAFLWPDQDGTSLS